jgi:ATP-dependent protease Clp ATPase subunit
VAQDGFVASFTNVSAEFVKERNLRPVRIALMGPPGAGKSHYASLLAAKYYLPIVRCGDAVALALGQVGCRPVFFS